VSCQDLSHVTFLLFIQAKVKKGPKQPASSTKTGDKQKKKKKKAQGWKDDMRARLLNDLQKSQNQSGEDGKKPS